MPAAAVDPNFEIEAVVSSSSAKKNITFTNVHNYTVMKSPFNKLANLTTITVESGFAYLSMISDEVKAKREPKCKISIYNLEKKTKQGESNRWVRGTLLYSFDFFIYFAIEEQGLDDVKKEKQLHDQSKIYTFVLANPILHWLQTNHEHIVLQDNMSANEAILSYEGYLTSKFEGGAFSFQHLAKDANKYKYEQIFTRSKWDLDVPTELILNYKAFDSLAYYYFDDFNIAALSGDNMLTSAGGSNNKAINNITLSLGSVLQLPKVDMLDENHQDSLMHVSVDSIESAADSSMIFQKQTATIAVETSDAHINVSKPTDKTDKRPIVSGGSVTSHDKTVSVKGAGRTVHGKSIVVSNSDIIPQHHTVLYSPDDIKSAHVRFQNSQRLITSDIKSYIGMTFQQCFPDLINLTSLYNLDTSSRTRFAYLPIAISNIFHKQESKDSRLTHSIKAKFMEFNL